jgi:hypothetical protein
MFQTWQHLQKSVGRDILQDVGKQEIVMLLSIFNSLCYGVETPDFLHISASFSVSTYWSDVSHPLTCSLMCTGLKILVSFIFCHTW